MFKSCIWWTVVIILTCVFDFNVGIATVSSVMAPAAVMGGVPGVGVGERMFPPQAGLTFVSWVCIDQYSSTTEDQHPVRLLTIMRQFRGGNEKVPNVPCLAISISARDRMLVVWYLCFFVSFFLSKPRLQAPVVTCSYASTITLKWKLAVCVFDLLTGLHRWNWLCWWCGLETNASSSWPWTHRGQVSEWPVVRGRTLASCHGCP